MNLFQKIVKRNPDTILGKMISDNSEHLSAVSFILYFLPIIILVFTCSDMSNDVLEIPMIYSFLIFWYFIALGMIGIFNGDNLINKITDFVVCLPIYYSLILTYFIFKIFRNKEKYPNVTEDYLPLYRRTVKVRKLKKKIKRKNFLKIFICCT